MTITNTFRKPWYVLCLLHRQAYVYNRFTTPAPIIDISLLDFAFKQTLNWAPFFQTSNSSQNPYLGMVFPDIISDSQNMKLPFFTVS